MLTLKRSIAVAVVVASLLTCGFSLRLGNCYRSNPHQIAGLNFVLDLFRISEIDMMHDVGGSACDSVQHQMSMGIYRRAVYRVIDEAQTRLMLRREQYYAFPSCGRCQPTAILTRVRLIHASRRSDASLPVWQQKTSQKK